MRKVVCGFTESRPGPIVLQAFLPMSAWKRTKKLLLRNLYEMLPYFFCYASSQITADEAFVRWAC